MQIVRGIFSPLPRLASHVATIGAFDGVHRGHQAILADTVEWARHVGGHAVAVTFDPLPKSVVGPRDVLCITSLRHRLALLERAGIDVAVVLQFDAALADMSPDDFVHRVLLDWLATDRIVLGYDASFGRGGAGNLAYLRSLEAQGLLEVRSPAPVLYAKVSATSPRESPKISSATLGISEDFLGDFGKIISSTAIRRAIARGDLDTAAAMLGRPFSLLGTVVQGHLVGRSLGFPTANLDLHHEAFPPRGIYAAYSDIDGQRYPALTYIGTRPTFSWPPESPVVEVHLVGLDTDLYGRDIEVHFIQKLRDEMRFPSADSLIAQMKSDREAALAAYARLSASPS